MNILILDIGNSKTKCYIIRVRENLRYANPFECLYAASEKTPREHPYDLIALSRNMIKEALASEVAQVGMITAFGDAFIHYKQGEHPYYVFADEPADKGIPYAYSLTGFPLDIQLTSVRALKSKHNAEWQHMYSPNGWVAMNLSEKPDKNPRNAWDITQASVTGCFNLQKRKWIHTGFTRFPSPPPIPSHKVIGTIEGIPFLAGGMDNAFCDTEDKNPFIVAGTWLVISVCFGNYNPDYFTEKRRNIVRWLISGNNKLYAQIVRKVSNPITEADQEQILDDLMLLGQSSYLMKDEDGFTQRIKPRIKIFGGYGEALAESLQPMTHKYHFYTAGPAQEPELYQHYMSALFVHNHYRKDK